MYGVIFSMIMVYINTEAVPKKCFSLVFYKYAAHSQRNNHAEV